MSELTREEVMKTELGRRILHWPRGYQGDAETIDLLLEINRNSTFYEFPLVKGHINRIFMIVDWIYENLDSNQQILMLGCGHARELPHVPTDKIYKLTLVDFDKQSLEVASKNAQKKGYTVTPIHANVLDLIRNKVTLPYNYYQQIICAGLADYLSDNTLRRLMKYMRSIGGYTLLTNVDHTYLTQLQLYFMDHVLRWKLNYRSIYKLKTLAKEADWTLKEFRIDETLTQILVTS